MSKLRRLLSLLCCAALLFLLHYVWLRPPSKFVASEDNFFKTYGEGHYLATLSRTIKSCNRSKQQRLLCFFATEMPNDKGESYKKRNTYLDLGASPAKVELQGDVLFASEGQCNCARREQPLPMGECSVLPPCRLKESACSYRGMMVSVIR